MVGRNVFMFQFASEEDMHMVIDNCPWTFDGGLVGP